jgi:molecular chaperone GrpE
VTSESENTAPESSDKELSDAVDEALAEVEVDEVAVLTSDLQRVQAEYSNYRKRVDRDRITANEITTAIVLSEFLPVLDDISRAEEHGELTGGFKAVADQLQTITSKLGLTKFSDVDVPFDPNIHEALMHSTSPEVTETSVTQVLQPGFKFKDRVIRPARVAVTDPENSLGKLKWQPRIYTRRICIQSLASKRVMMLLR